MPREIENGWLGTPLVHDYAPCCWFCELREATTERNGEPFCDVCAKKEDQDQEEYRKELE